MSAAQYLQIRFTRKGRKKLPFYRLVAVDSRKRRDGRPLEVCLYLMVTDVLADGAMTIHDASTCNLDLMF